MEEADISEVAEPSYALQNQIQSALALYAKPILDVNQIYRRTRRYDVSGDVKIFEPKTKIRQVDKNKPCMLNLGEHEEFMVNPDFALLKYFWMFQDQIDKEEIDLNFIKSLVDTGVDINTRDEFGQTVLHAIVRDWHADVALFAVRHNADVNVQDNYGRTPLHLAAALKYADTAKILLKNGADPNVETFKEFHTPVHYAANYNSVEALRILLKFGGSITSKDYKGRTVTFIAAEAGSEDIVHFLLEIEAPFGVFDNDGNSALIYMIEKMPNLAFQALGQYMIIQSVSQCQMFVGYLESDGQDTIEPANRKAKTPLEVITSYNDIDLIMHPVIQKCIEIKWQLFGRLDTIKKLLITFIYLLCWLILAYTLTDNDEFYYDKNGEWGQHGWKMLFELFIIVFALYFFFKDLMLMKQQLVHHQCWLQWKKRLIRSQYTYCHPAWPAERESLEAEKQRIQLLPSLAGKQKSWFVYEWIILLFLSGVIITRVFAMIFSDSKFILLIHKVVFGINMIFSFIRMLKIAMRFRYFSVFVKVASLSLTSFIQIGFLYFQVYIPFVAAFWVLFGVYKDDVQHFNTLAKNETNLTIPYIHATNSSATSNNSSEIEMTIIPSVLQMLDPALLTLKGIFFSVYGVSFGQEDLYKIKRMDSVAFQTITSLYHIFSTLHSCDQKQRTRAGRGRSNLATSGLSLHRD